MDVQDLVASPAKDSAPISTSFVGVVRFLHITPRAFLPMRSMPEITLVAGKGIEGDRYMIGREEGFYSDRPEEGRQVTLFRDRDAGGAEARCRRRAGP